MRLSITVATAFALLWPSAADTQQIGTAAAVNPRVTATPPGGQSRLLMVGSDVEFEERIVTSPDGQTQILFLDQSSLTVGPGAEVVLDRFIYDPSTSTGELAISVTKGVFRFVGGKISANSGATIRTPAATLGIRGSIVYGESGAACAGDGCLDLVYVAGEGLTVKNAAGTMNFTRGGRHISVPTPTTLPRDLGSATAADITRFVQALEGSGGAGAPVAPSEVVVQRKLKAPPEDVPTQQAEDTSEAASGEGRNTVATVDEANDVAEARQDDATEDLTESRPLATGLTGRLLATPETGFTSEDGTVYNDPLAQNVLGGPDPTFSPAISDGTITATGRFQASTDEGPIDLPFQPGPFTFGAADTETPFGPIAGIGAGAPNFVAYAGTQVNDSSGNRVVIISGEATPDGGNLASPNLRLTTYEVAQDPVFRADIPFVPEELANAFTDPTVSDLFILRKDGGRIADGRGPIRPRSRFLIGAGAIEGQGASQRSFLLGSEGGLSTTSNGKLSLSSAMRGSFRLDTARRPTNVGGSVGAISDADGDQFFGPDLDFFALTTTGPLQFDSDPDVDIGSAVASPYDEPGEAYSYAHLVTQVTPDAEIGARSTRLLLGYSAAMGESRLAGNVFEAPYVLTSTDPTSGLAMDAGTNSLAALFALEQATDRMRGQPPPSYTSDVDSVTLGFGGIGSHVGTYIDDETYAALNTRTPGLYGDINGERGLPSPDNPDGFRSILLAHEIVPMEDILPDGAELAECDCFEWGWWASEFRWADESGPNQLRRERFHMGTFVAGDIPAQNEVESIIQQGQIATYSGHIVGNVYNRGAQYIAGGDFSHRVDFGARTGTVSARFDNRSYSGTSALGGAASSFSGRLSSNDGGAAVEGFLNGSFVRNGTDPVGGMIGTKRFYDVGTNGSTYRASATFAGTRAGASLSE